MKERVPNMIEGLFLHPGTMEDPEMRGTLFWGPYSKDPII